MGASTTGGARGAEKGRWREVGDDADKLETLFAGGYIVSSGNEQYFDMGKNIRIQYCYRKAQGSKQLG